MQTTALLDKYDALEPVWRSEPVSSDYEGAFSSPVVAARRDYLEIN